MNQIAGIDGFDLMNNLRLVIIAAIFIVIVIVFLFNRILGSRRGVKQKSMQAVNSSDDKGSLQSDDSWQKMLKPSREEQDAPGVVDDFFGMKEEESKGGESTAESGVEIEGQPVVNYEKIEADLKAIRDEVATKIEGLILKVEAVEKEVLNKIEDIIDVKIQEVSNKINDRITEVLGTQRNSIPSVSEERVDSLRNEEIPAGLPSEDTVMSEEIEEKGQTDTIVPSEAIEENISGGEAGESVGFDIEKFLEEEPVGMQSEEEPKELAEEVGFEEKKERDLEAPVEDHDILEKLAGSLQMDDDSFDVLPSDESETVAEVKEDVKVDEVESIEAGVPAGEIEENISVGDFGESVDFDIEKFLEEEPVDIPFTEESREVEEEKVEEEKSTEAITSSGETEEKVSEKAKSEEEKKSTGETVDFDIQDFLEELGNPPSEKG